MTNALPLLTFLEIIIIFFLSRTVINELFYFLRFFWANNNLIYAVVSLIFIPGTIVHEMGHFVAATILGLRVYEVKIFPQWEKNQIKLGSVLYEKKDFVRGILVGIAPIFFAMSFFWFLAKFNLFPNANLPLNIFLGYVVFAVSSTMFSSKKDMVDFIFVIPVMAIGIGIVYILNIRPEVLLKNKMINNAVGDFFGEINFYLLFSIVVNLTMISLFKSFRYFFKK